ncbi:xanthine dehydrogenase accessory protein XdhC [Breoghania sp.]|uniref:xanthine dehydrogenase accessory protein XdhC n=1 Tax=Breoghania sp. TaxID=2065378 RepID=UPI0029CA96A1|nr:xanthine dehydrogenase accessory protein XdhC [Breoghania sp.]
MTLRVWNELADAVKAEGAAALVTVLRVAGSAPREAGARLVVRPSGGFRGTIGGGGLEWKAIALARDHLAEKSRPSVMRRYFALGPEFGQCCGGRAELLIERFTGENSAGIAEFASRETEGPFVTLAAIDASDEPHGSAGGGLERRVLSHVPTGNGDGARLTGAGVLEERFGCFAQPLMLFGAGHVGRATALALAPLPFSVTWVDSRAEAFPAAVPSNVSIRRTDSPADVLAEGRDGAFVLVMTHSHPLDFDIAATAISQGRFGYVGLIGSRTKRIRFERRMKDMGISEQRIGELVCPIGIKGIRSREPAAIAAATVAELLIRREGGSSIDIEMDAMHTERTQALSRAMAKSA